MWGNCGGAKLLKPVHVNVEYFQSFLKKNFSSYNIYLTLKISFDLYCIVTKN